MKPYAVVLSTVVLAAVSSTARADVTSPAEPGSADPAALALDAERSAEAHKAMLRTAVFSRDPGMATHCRALIARYAAEAAAHRQRASASN